MGFSDFVNKAKDLADQHDEQVDQGLDRAGDMAKERFAGHDEQIDSVVDRAQQYTGDGDTTAGVSTRRRRCRAARRPTCRPSRARSRRSDDPSLTTPPGHRGTTPGAPVVVRGAQPAAQRHVTGLPGDAGAPPPAAHAGSPAGRRRARRFPSRRSPAAARTASTDPSGPASVGQGQEDLDLPIVVSGSSCSTPTAPAARAPRMFAARSSTTTHSAGVRPSRAAVRR